MENDAVTAAIAEHRTGAGKSSPRMLMVTLGTGIGVALLIDGVPFRGLGGVHPEAGHVPILTSAVRCYCGAFGCWEQLASRAALQVTLRALLPGDIADKDLLARAAQEAREPAIADSFTAYGRLVGRGLSTHHALYMPETTVIAGSVAPYLELIRSGIDEALTQVNPLTPPVSLHAAILADEAGAIGAALLAEHLVASS
jgi:glucokinase